MRKTNQEEREKKRKGKKVWKIEGREEAAERKKKEEENMNKGDTKNGRKTM